MEKFISLLKKDLSGQISEAEKRYLLELIKADAEFDIIYQEICSRRADLPLWDEYTEVIEAYKRHWVKMRKLNLL